MSHPPLNEAPSYGIGDASYQAAHGEPGLRNLAQDFYELMSTLPFARAIREMHRDELEEMVDKLTLFLSVWLGGPRTYFEKYGRRSMPEAHRHLVIEAEERDAWLACMDLAIAKQPFAESFKTYLAQQLRFPAEMIRKTSRSRDSVSN